MIRAAGITHDYEAAGRLLADRAAFEAFCALDYWEGAPPARDEILREVVRFTLRPQSTAEVKQVSLYGRALAHAAACGVAPDGLAQFFRAYAGGLTGAARAAAAGRREGSPETPPPRGKREPSEGAPAPADVFVELFACMRRTAMDLGTRRMLRLLLKAGERVQEERRTEARSAQAQDSGPAAAGPRPGVLQLRGGRRP